MYGAFGLALMGFLAGFVDSPFRERWRSQDQHVATFGALVEDEKEAVDLVFLGTSRTMNGIDTEWMDQHSGVKALNLGLNWFGHGVRLNQCHELFKMSQPKVLVLEVPYLLRYGIHRFCAQSLCRQTLLATPWFRPDVMARLCWPSVPQRLAALLLSGAQPSELRLLGRGYFPVPMTLKQKNKAKLAAEAWLAKGRALDVGGEPSLAQGLYRSFFYAHQLSYLQAIADLCHDEDCRLVLLRIPKASLWAPDPWLERSQQRVAELWSPPPQLLCHPQLWRDEGHLNEDGALILSKWILDQLSHDSRT